MKIKNSRIKTVKIQIMMTSHQ